MNGWMEVYYISTYSVGLILSLQGICLTAIIPGVDHWRKRFFLIYFAVFLLCDLFCVLEVLAILWMAPKGLLYLIQFVECTLLALPVRMLTVYVLYCCGENITRSRIFHAVNVISAFYLVFLAAGEVIGATRYVSPELGYQRGPLYPLFLLPMILMLLVNLAVTLRRRKRFSRKTFLSLLIAILPVMIALSVQMFIDVYPLVGISYVISALSMYGLVLSEQLEVDQRNQQEIARQRASIMVLQMRPHFIYNTLMSIYSLCNLDPQKARKVTMDFTNYLRRNFNAVASESTIPFSAELEHTRAYLAVEQVQHEEMLIVEYDTPFTQFHLPPLTMQPLVENAVKHAMDPYSGPLHISVRTLHDENGAQIIVEDDGSGFDPSDKSQPQATLTNIRQRLEMMCGGSLTIRSGDGKGTQVKITIPDSTESPLLLHRMTSCEQN